MLREGNEAVEFMDTFAVPVRSKPGSALSVFFSFFSLRLLLVLRLPIGILVYSYPIL